MGADSDSSDPLGQPDREPSAERSGEPGRPERYGPLTLARHRKDDGRSLILYTLEEPRP
ncbi:MAG TPA: hypothetical protein VHY83_15245 [Solirubrobacteraceae bacterium]|jgi:hypothetical protein|nr:hypothetical protein [Solirubrobacteraceae bacterium]